MNKYTLLFGGATNLALCGLWLATKQSEILVAVQYATGIVLLWMSAAAFTGEKN